MPEPRPYCTTHGAMLADDCVECMGEAAVFSTEVQEFVDAIQPFIDERDKTFAREAAKPFLHRIFPTKSE